MSVLPFGLSVGRVSKHRTAVSIGAIEELVRDLGEHKAVGRDVGESVLGHPINT